MANRKSTTIDRRVRIYDLETFEFNRALQTNLISKMIRVIVYICLFLVPIAFAAMQQPMEQQPQNQIMYQHQAQAPLPKKLVLDDEDSSDDDDPEFEDDWSSADRLSTKDLDARRFYKLKFRRMYLRKLERILKRIGQGVEVRKQKDILNSKRCGKKKRRVVEYVDANDVDAQHVHHYYQLPAVGIDPTVIHTHPPMASVHVPTQSTVVHVPANAALANVPTTPIVPPESTTAVINVPRRKKTVIYYDE